MDRLHSIGFICFFLFLGMKTLLAGENEDDISDFFTRQLIAYPHEKIYLQSDKTHYLSGETVWFSATIVDALFHEPVYDDNYLFTELRNPLDSVVTRIIIKPDSLNGYYGSIPLNENLAEGDYILVAYRNTMTNADYFFKRMIYVSDPVSTVILPECKFSESENEFLVDITFVNPQTKEKLLPDNVSVQVNGGKMNMLTLSEDAIGRFSFRKSDVEFPVLTLHVAYQSKKLTKYIPLSISGSDYEVMFFPEGGQLITGAPSVIAFKAINQNGLSESVTGHIEDEEGNVIQHFESIHKGMGKVLLQPEPGETYYAVCHNKDLKEKRFKLPEAQKGNFSLQVDRQQKWVAISVTGLSQVLHDPQLSLFIHTKGLPLYHNKWNNEKNLLLIEQDSFPSGISHLILLNPNNEIVSERLIFNRNKQDEAVINFVTGADNYGKRELVTSKISLTDSQGAPLSGKFAVSVIDDKYVSSDNATNILSVLLLDSDLKGHIEDAACYFQDKENESSIALDLLMMTQGWRRYNIPALLKGNIEIPKTDGFNEKILTGKAERFFRAIKDVTISLIINTPTGSELKVTTTDKNGRFVFDNLTYPDSTFIIVQSSDKKGDDNIYLTVDRQPELQYKVSAPELFVTENDTQYFDYTVVAEQKYVNEHGIRMIELPEVAVSAKKYIPKSVYYSQFQVFEVMTSADIEKVNLGTMHNLLLRLPEVSRIELGGKSSRNADADNVKVYVRTRGEEHVAKFIVNDYTVKNFQLESVGLDMIESIFVLKEDIFDAFDSRPAIVITTKKGGWGGKSNPPQNIRKIEWSGYSQPVEFYSPKYETMEEKNAVKEDLRTTLYWNPRIQTSEQGEASFDFYSSDAPTTYSVIMEGITNDGKIVRHTAKINRK